MSAAIICDQCYCTVDDSFIARHLDKHRQDQEEKAELMATVGMLIEIVVPDATTLQREHGIEVFSTPGTTKVEFGKSVMAMGAIEHEGQ